MLFRSSKIAAAEAAIRKSKKDLSDIDAQIKKLEPEFVKRRDELMSEVPRQLYSTGQARSVIREAIEDKYETTKDLLDDVAGARKHLIERLNEEVAKEPEVDPARWERDQSYILNAFDSMVADLRKAQEAIAARKRNELWKEVFGSDEKAAIAKVGDMLSKLRPNDATPLSKRIPWKAILEMAGKDKGVVRDRMLENLLSDPVFEGLPAADVKKLIELVEKAFKKQSDKYLGAVLDRLQSNKHWDKKLLAALRKKEDGGVRSQLLKWIAAGALTNEKFYREIAKEYGFRDMTKDEQDRVVKIADELRENKIPNWKKVKLLKELKDILAEVGAPTFLEMANALWYASVLSSPRTLLDIGLSALNAAWIAGTSLTTMAFDRKNWTSGDMFKVPTAALEAVIRNSPNIVRNAWKYVMTGNEVYLDKSDSPIDALMKERLQSGIGYDSIQIGERMVKRGKNPLTKLIGQFIKFQGRLMLALDEIGRAHV